MIGKAILLNGASSAGKTSIVKLLQENLDEIYLNVSVDGCVSQFLTFYLNKPEYFGKLEAEIPNFNKTFCRIALAMVETGNNIIIDTVLTGGVDIANFVETFKEIDVILVGVKCELEVLIKREIERKDRKIGLAARQFDLVHEHGPYDIEVSTTDNNFADCANRIKEYIISGEKPKSIKKWAALKLM